MTADTNPTKLHRRQVVYSAARLRRARRLYIRLIAASVEAHPDVLIGCAARVIFRGTLYRGQSHVGVRYALLRGIYKLQMEEAYQRRKPFIDWWTWFQARGFVPFTFMWVGKVANR